MSVGSGDCPPATQRERPLDELRIVYKRFMIAAWKSHLGGNPNRVNVLRTLLPGVPECCPAAPLASHAERSGRGSGADGCAARKLIC